jgi:pyruvate kinase
VDYRLRENGLARDGERVVIVAGMPPGVVGTTNSIRIHKIGETATGRIQRG